MLKGLRRGWVLGGEEFRDRMSDLASGIIKGHQRASYSGDEVRGHDETARPVHGSPAGSRPWEWISPPAPAVPSDPRKRALAWLIRTKSNVGKWAILATSAGR